MRILIEVDGGIATLTHWCDGGSLDTTVDIFDHDIEDNDDTSPHWIQPLDNDNKVSAGDYDRYLDKMFDAHFDNA